MKFIITFIGGMLAMVLMAEIHEGSAQQACMDMGHSKCELLWVPINKSKGDKP